MSDGNEVALEAIQELRQIKSGETKPFEVTPDIDVVWVVSQPGTYSKPSEDGIYTGHSYDRDAIDYGISLVKQIAILRLKEKNETVSLDNITKEQILENGPVLFYNGEDKDTEENKYTQNEDLLEAVKSGDFPLPEEKVIVDHIKRISTPEQVSGFMKFFKDKPDIRKVAVISTITHSRRVGRYLEEFKIKHPDLFLSNTEFLDAWIPVKQHQVGITLREIKRVKKYYEKGDLSKDPIEGF